MPFNKIHDLMDDAPSVPYMDTRHVTRAGLMLNTAAKSKAVVLSQADIARLMNFTANEGVLDMDKLREQGPIVLQFDGQRDDKGRFVIALLTVPMDEGNQVTCFPYSNNNEKDKMWPYDKHFVFGNVSDLKKITIQTRDTHPLASAEDLDELGKTHLSALSAIVLKFLFAQQQGLFTVVPDNRDYSKLNKKREKSKKSPFVPDNLLVWSK
jgi:hypothetical protein